MFKDIVGLPGYKVSHLGDVIQVKNKEFSSDVVTFKDEEGFNCIGVNGENGELKTYRVDRLVMNAFYPRSNKSEVYSIIHINKDITDDKLRNLMWDIPLNREE